MGGGDTLTCKSEKTSKLDHRKVGWYFFVAGVRRCAGPTSAGRKKPRGGAGAAKIEVPGTTPLLGSDVPLTKLPANAQVFTSDDFRNQQQNNATGFLERNGTGPTVNAAQGNSHQPEVNCRRFSASPLLGTPQGLSVFVDGVPANEVFGDTLNWDLILQSAIPSIQLIPGSSPAFGPNTLGGSIGYPIKPGSSIATSGASFGRRLLGFETGSKRGNLNCLLADNGARDSGWAQQNASRVNWLFGKVCWQDANTDLNLTFTHAKNRLAGTQTLPLSFTNIREP